MNCNRNPIRYRGYYYDKESGLYYLQSRYYDPVTSKYINADGYVSTGQSLIGNNMFSYCGNNPVMRSDSSGLFWQEAAEIVEAVAKIVAQIAAEASANAAAAAARSTTGSIIAGGVFRQLPNGLATALTAQSNTLSTISSGASKLGKLAGAAGMTFGVIDVSVKVYNNFNNDNLSLSRKISDSVVDAGVTAGSMAIGAAIGTAFPIPIVGTAFGALAGGVIGYVADNTPIVGWVKDGVGAAVDYIGNAAKAVGNFFGSLFG